VQHIYTWEIKIKTKKKKPDTDEVPIDQRFPRWLIREALPMGVVRLYYKNPDRGP
jgi:hypothetical protein